VAERKRRLGLFLAAGSSRFCLLPSRVIGLRQCARSGHKSWLYTAVRRKWLDIRSCCATTHRGPYRSIRAKRHVINLSRKTRRLDQWLSFYPRTYITSKRGISIHPSVYFCRQVQTSKHTGRVEKERKLSVKSTHQ